MKTQKFVHTGEPEATAQIVGPGTTTMWTAQQTCLLDEDPDWNYALEKTKQHSLASRSIRFGPYPQREKHKVRAQHRWGIILAGGDGIRLRELTKWVSGDNRPKQFCPLLSDHTLLEETRHRAERSVPPEHILYSVRRVHEPYYLPCLAGRGSQRIVQPSNRGTAPAIVTSLIPIAKSDPDATVVVFPCDHYYSSETAFTIGLESAFQIAEQRSGSIVMLGVAPESPETEYGWIEIGPTSGGHAGVFRVACFREKPQLAQAQTLLRRGSLWNTFVMVGRVSTFLEIAWITVPCLLEAIESVEVTASSSGEIRIPDSIYERIVRTDFSRHILTLATDKLLALRLENMKWSDLGDPYRMLVAILEKNGKLPDWALLWLNLHSTPPGAFAVA